MEEIIATSTTTGETVLMQNADTPEIPAVSFAMQPVDATESSQAKSFAVRPAESTSKTAQAISSAMAESLDDLAKKEEDSAETAQAIPAAMGQSNQYYDGRKQVQRKGNKPNKPYRPSKEEWQEL